jgi:hypothetical protein
VWIVANALLASLAIPGVDPLVLQASAGGEGAYDARQFCKKALQPFVTAHGLHVVFGTREHPSTTTPARRPTLSRDYKAKGKLAKDLACDIVEEAKRQPELRAALLQDLLHLAHQAQGTVVSAKEKIAEIKDVRLLEGFADRLLASSCSGQSTVFLVGVAATLFGMASGRFLHSVYQLLELAS